MRTYAPMGQTPMRREWWTRDHLSAISAISPEGKVYFHSQESALNAADVVACLEHLLREVPGRMVIIGDGAPMHRRQVIQDFLGNGTAQRIHVERLPAYAPELNPGEGGSVRFRANRVKAVFSSMHNPPFLLATREDDGFTSHPKKPAWREI